MCTLKRGWVRVTDISVFHYTGFKRFFKEGFSPDGTSQEKSVRTDPFLRTATAESS
jgi:hypothetical protein